MRILRIILLSSLAASIDVTQRASRSGPVVGGVVNTTSGRVQGFASSLRSGVSTYLGIPYAKPPVGNLRFAPPVKSDYNGTILKATAFGPDCPANIAPFNPSNQYSNASSNIFKALAQTGDVFSEDCLSLNIWTKSTCFSTGNTAEPTYDGSILADENDVVIVSANYRLNIFGFPTAPGIQQNVGLLDQRLAVEWVRDNIANFGGDPKRITIFGQSAGGASVDLFTRAWVKDPIINGAILESGTSSIVVSPSLNYTSWYAVSALLGCGGASSGPGTVNCVRERSMQAILNATASLSSGSSLSSNFVPAADNITVFPDPDVRGKAGNFVHVPILTGVVDNEWALTEAIILGTVNYNLSLLPPGLAFSTNITNLQSFTCPAAQAAQYRVENLVPAWKYRYYGLYPNLQISPLPGAYHGSEIFAVFGTTEYVTKEANTDVQNAVGKYMRKAWTSFAKDPVRGLVTEMGWPPYNPWTKSLIRLGYGQETNASYALHQDTDALCPLLFCLTQLASSENLGNTDAVTPFITNLLQNGFLSAFQNATATYGPTFTEKITLCLSGLNVGADLVDLAIENLAGGIQ